MASKGNVLAFRNEIPSKLSPGRPNRTEEKRRKTEKRESAMEKAFDGRGAWNFTSPVVSNPRQLFTRSWVVTFFQRLPSVSII